MYIVHTCIMRINIPKMTRISNWPLKLRKGIIIVTHSLETNFYIVSGFYTVSQPHTCNVCDQKCV